MRRVRTLVLPAPADATTIRGAASLVTASYWAGDRSTSSSSSLELLDSSTTARSCTRPKIRIGCDGLVDPEMTAPVARLAMIPPNHRAGAATGHLSRPAACLAPAVSSRTPRKTPSHYRVSVGFQRRLHKGEELVLEIGR